MSRDWWPAADAAYRPSALLRLAEALDSLHELAYPGTRSPSAIRIGTSPRAESEDPDPDEGRRWARYKLRSIERDVDRLARKASSKAADLQRSDGNAPKGGWRCHHCGRKQRWGARFCDGCGAAEPEEETRAS